MPGCTPVFAIALINVPFDAITGVVPTVMPFLTTKFVVLAKIHYPLVDQIVKKYYTVIAVLISLTVVTAFAGVNNKYKLPPVIETSNVPNEALV